MEVPMDILKVEKSIRESILVKQRLLKDKRKLAILSRMALIVAAAYQQGNRLLIAGNGGSAADAQHFAAEITCQFLRQRQGRSAIALHTDTSALTAWANDYSYGEVYARLVAAHGCPGDVLFVLSTSGNSENLVQAATVARARDMQVLGLLGKGGGRLVSEDLCDEFLIVPSTDTPRIQECHTLCIHVLCEYLDEVFIEMDSRVRE